MGVVVLEGRVNHDGDGFTLLLTRHPPLIARPNVRSEVVALEGPSNHHRRSVGATARAAVPSLPGQTCIFISMRIDRAAHAPEARSDGSRWQTKRRHRNRD